MGGPDVGDENGPGNDRKAHRTLHREARRFQISRHARRDGRQHRRHRVRARVERRRRRLPDHALDPDGRVLGGGRRRRPHQHLRPAADLRRARGRARRRGGDRGPVDDRPARRQLLLRPGHRLHARVALRGGRQAADLRAQRRRAGDDQVDAQRARRARRLPLRRRHRLLPALRQERAVGGRSQHHLPPHRRARLEPGHHRAGRLPDHPSDRVVHGSRARADRRVPGARPRTSSRRRRRRSASSTATPGGAFRCSGTSTTR